MSLRAAGPLRSRDGQAARLIRDALALAGAACWFIVDATGVGRPVVDAFNEAGLHPMAATIPAGNAVNYDYYGATVSVPKRDLISSMAVLLESRRLKIAEALPGGADAGPRAPGVQASGHPAGPRADGVLARERP